MVWNLGEENTNTTRQRVNYSEYLKWLDPYDHPVVVHTYPNQYDQVYEPLLGLTAFDGPSLQMGDMTKTHAETLKWVKASAAHGHPWFVSLDEIGPAHTGVKPDADDSDHLDVVRHALWGNLMAGGAGVEWYFGYQYAHHDLYCEDWRFSRKMWRLTRIALDFFGDLPDLPSMQPSDELVDLAGAYCLSEAGKTYVLYLPNGTPTNLDLRGLPVAIEFVGSTLVEEALDASGMFNQSKAEPLMSLPARLLTKPARIGW